MNIAVVDDIASERALLSGIIGEYAALCRLALPVTEFDSAESFLSVYRPFSFFAIFMDIYMDGMNGVEAAAEIRKTDADAHIIFLTTSNAHMPEAFHLHAYDYLDKPASRGRLFAVLDDLLKQHTSNSNAPQLSFSSDRIKVSIPYPDVRLVRTAKSNYIEVFDTAGNAYLTHMTFSTAKELLEKDGRFLSLNRGLLVNMDEVVDIEEGICTLKDGMTLPVNVRKTKSIMDIFQNYMFEKIRKEGRDRRTRK